MNTWDEPTLDDVRKEFPAWICWRGVDRLFYARRQATPTGRYDAHGEDPLDLRDAILLALRMEEYARRD